MHSQHNVQRVYSKDGKLHSAKSSLNLPRRLHSPSLVSAADVSGVIIGDLMPFHNHGEGTMRALQTSHQPAQERKVKKEAIRARLGKRPAQPVHTL